MKLLLALLFFLIAAPSAYAQSQLPPNIFDNAAGAPGTVDPPIVADNCPAYSGFTLNPCVVDEATFVVEARIEDVPPLTSGQYYYCLKTNPKDCDDDDLEPVGNRYALGTVTFPCLTGDGDKKMKESCDDDGSNWFHSGKIYRVSLFDDDEEGAYTGREAAFYIVHYYPDVVRPQQGAYPPLDPSLNVKAVRAGNGYDLVVELSGRNPRDGNDDKYNDYYLRVDGYDNDYKSQETCLFVGGGGSGTATVTMPKQYTDDEGKVRDLTEGTYLLKIFDGKDGNFSETNATCEENDFVYYYVPLSVGQGDRPGIIGPAIKDPKGKELSVARVRPVPVPICPPEDQNEYGYCTKIPTALGIKINTDPALFIRDVFTIVLSVGGAAATIFFIQAGYTLMTSAGNKEKVGAAREQITAAIMGLIFIILSITILEFIGVNILRIPGFSN